LADFIFDINTIVAGNNGNKLLITIRNAGSIEGATVRIAIKRGAEVFTKQAVIIDAASGKCEVTLSATDLPSSGLYFYQPTITYADGREFTGEVGRFTVGGKLSGQPPVTIPVGIDLNRLGISANNRLTIDGVEQVGGGTGGDIDAKIAEMQQQLNDLQIEVNALKQGGGGTTPPADTTAPVLTISPNGGNFASTQGVTMTTNETADIYYTLDGSTPTTASSKYTAALSLSVTTTLKAFARDTAGNSSAIQTVTFTKDVTAPTDTTAPILTITAPATFTDTQTVNMSVNEAGSTIYYTIDGTEPKTSGTKMEYTSPLTLTATVTVKAYAVDTAGNQSGVQTVTYTKQIPTDTTPPNPVTSLMAGTAELNSVPLTWGLSTSTDVVNYEVAYSTDGINFTVAKADISSASNTYIVTGLIASTNYTFRVIGIDGAGNRSTPVTIQKATLTPGLVKSLYMNQTAGSTHYLRTPVISFTKIEMVYEAEWNGAAAYYVGCRNYTSNPAYASMNAETTDYESLVTIRYSYLTSPDVINLPPLPRKRMNKASFDFKGVVMNYNPTIFARDNLSSYMKGIIYDIKFYNGETVVAHYDMRTGTVQDQSGNGNHATLVGGQFVDEPPYEEVITWVGGVEQ
jgi:hypothetical protein